MALGHVLVLGESGTARGTAALGVVLRGGGLPVLLGGHWTIFDSVTTGDKGCLVIEGFPAILSKRMQQVVEG